MPVISALRRLSEPGLYSETPSEKSKRKNRKTRQKKEKIK
jgi:hypothetical protein